MGFPPPIKYKGMFLKLREKILKAKGGYKYQALVKYSALWNVLHMSELIETQGIYPLRNYMKKVDEKDSKSAKMLMKTEEILEIKKLISSGNEDHPKLKKLVDIVKSLKDKKMIVFAQYRDQIKKIEEELNDNGLDARQFVGKREGVTRKMQEKTIADFRNDDFDILVASSIAEEGLDIPKVDAVIFYEPIPSEIRSIQRRGRAARLKEGEIYILMTKETRDEYYYWSSQSKEKKMKKILSSMQTTILRERARKEGNPLPPKKINGQTRISHFT